MKKAFLLDRDGVINKSPVIDGKPVAPKTFEDFEILPGVKEALEFTRKKGFLNIVITNQPDVLEGTLKKEVLEACHKKMVSELALDAIFICYDRNAPCYKPKPGLIFEAKEKYDIDLSKSFVVGDRWRDIGAGIAAGCTTIFIDYKYSENLIYQPDYTFKSLHEAVREILK